MIAPPEWRTQIRNAWLNLNTKLFCTNSACIQMLDVWKKYKNENLVKIPNRCDFPIDIQKFQRLQIQHLEAVRSRFTNE